LQDFKREYLEMRSGCSLLIQQEFWFHASGQLTSLRPNDFRDLKVIRLAL
jgi:hypothetical protein